MSESEDVEADVDGDDESFMEYIVREFNKNRKENIAFLVFFLMFAGFLVFWWLSIALGG